MRTFAPAFEETVFVKKLNACQSIFLPLLTELYKEAEKHLANRVPANFPKFTQHDINHSIRVMEYMSQLIEDIDGLNEFEICLLICGALLHDIGMASDSDTIQTIKEDRSGLTDIKYSAMVEKFSGNEELATQEMIRILHGDLAEQMVQRFYSGILKFPELDISFSVDAGLLCNSHTKESMWVATHLREHDEKSKYGYSLQFSSLLLRIGDILDFDRSRTPLILYKIIAPKGVSDSEWRQHFSITNLEKIKTDPLTRQKVITLYGECSDVSIHRKILNYIELINRELEYAVETSKKMEASHRLFLKDKVETHIVPKGYSISNYRLSIDFRSITTLLMGEKIYGEKVLGIRELIQNSIDACKVRREIEERRRTFGEDSYVPSIRIILDDKKGKVIIKDNGCGMDEEIIKKYFLNIGKSYYISDDYRLKKFQYQPIGTYGIGFLACFMLSDKVQVRTSQANDKQRYDIELERGSEYISFTAVEDPAFVGTEVCLEYNQFMSVLKDDKKVLKSFLSSYFLSDNVTIQLVDRSAEEESIVDTTLVISDQLAKNQRLVNLSGLLESHGGQVL